MQLNFVKKRLKESLYDEPLHLEVFRICVITHHSPPTKEGEEGGTRSYA